MDLVERKRKQKELMSKVHSQEDECQLCKDNLALFLMKRGTVCIGCNYSTLDSRVVKAVVSF